VTVALDPRTPVIAVHLPHGLGRDLFHLPAPARPRPGPNGGTVRIPFASTVCPDSWITLCGLEGLVYAYDGPFLRRRLCSVCEGELARRAGHRRKAVAA
jgi:hypothetical protein